MSGTIQLDNHGSEIQYIPNLFIKEQADRYFQQLKQGIEWQQEIVTVYGKTHKTPRLTAWYGDEDIEYTYSGLSVVTKAWTQTLNEIKNSVKAVANRGFNSVLLNLYRDGKDGVGWHSDDEPELGVAPVIASLSLGEIRRFDLRCKADHSQRYQLELDSGSLLIMRGNTQQLWQHQIAKRSVKLEARINLTFRNTNSFKNCV